MVSGFSLSLARGGSGALYLLRWLCGRPRPPTSLGSFLPLSPPAAQSFLSPSSPPPIKSRHHSSLPSSLQTKASSPSSDRPQTTHPVGVLHHRPKPHAPRGPLSSTSVTAHACPGLPDPARVPPTSAGPGTLTLPSLATPSLDRLTGHLPRTDTEDAARALPSACWASATCLGDSAAPPVLP